MTAVETLSFTKNGTRAADGDGMTVEQLVPGFAPETALERELTADPMLLRGLVWGRPRPGHPEGTVGHHVRDILSAISEPSGRRRAELRFLALVHDAFKYRVRPDAGYAPGNDHAVLARRFAERYTRDPRLLETLELHDAAYYIWRTRTNDGCVTLHALLARVPDLDLFLRFVELDNSTEGKDPRPLAWLRAAVDAGADLPELAVAGAWSDTRRRRRAVSPCHRSSSERRAVAHRVAAGEQGMSVAEKGATDAGSSAES